MDTAKFFLDAVENITPGREALLLVFGEQNVHGPDSNGIFRPL